jgi:mannose-6-phosphate isomerase-like protein (cupin superfamily)
MSEPLDADGGELGVAESAPWVVDVRRIDKPWGYELIWALTDMYCGKVLFVRQGQALSLQYHEKKDEAWLIQSGYAKLELGSVSDGVFAFSSISSNKVVGPGAAFHYPPGTVHRVTAITDTTILEVSTPHLDDVVRLDDAYGRQGTSAP